MTAVHPSRLDDSTLVAPLGLYSHAYVAPPGYRLMAIAGQLAVDVDGRTVGSTFEQQFTRVMENMEAVLAAAGTDLRAVMKFTTYLVEPTTVDLFYEVRSRLWVHHFPDERYPPNTLLVVQQLTRPELLIEIEALAAVP
jgi:2-iminobutanoate/2-iminopropanoate deaminase